MTVSRRSLLLAGAGVVLSGVGTAAYARFIEPGGAFQITRRAFTPARWTPGLELRIAVLADLHCGSAHMPLARVREAVDAALALEPDMILLLGDYVAGRRRNTHDVTPQQWARELVRLRAPLGVHAVMGNHEYWEDRDLQRRGFGDPFGKRAMLDAGMSVMENDALRLVKDGKPLWIAGLGDQLAFITGHGPDGRWRFRGLDDLTGLLAKVTDDAPLILMAHEPDVFARMHPRVNLTLSGHTHGGQVNLLGFAPWTPSRYGTRYRYGHIIERGQDLIVSAGMGTSGLPVRFAAPPEIVLLELG